jgi:hypothetical protein
VTAHPSVVFVGCARDCEKHLDGVLSNIANAAGRFAETAFLFVENGSVDGTAARLRSFGKGVAHFDLQVLSNQFAPHSMRTERLAAARNRYLTLIRQTSLRNFDYLIVYDMDDVNAARQSVDNLLQGIAFLESSPTHAAVFANQLGYYYDVFALRHASRCPGDAWEEVFDYVRAHRVSDEVAFAATYAKRMFNIDPATPLIEVDSAFGGLGIYKMKYILDGEHIGVRPKTCMDEGRTRRLLWQVCEHVSLHAAIRAQGGRLFIAPWMLNAAFEVTNLRPEQICSPSVFRALYRMLD